MSRWFNRWVLLALMLLGGVGLLLGPPVGRLLLDGLGGLFRSPGLVFSRDGGRSLAQFRFARADRAGVVVSGLQVESVAAGGAAPGPAGAAVATVATVAFKLRGVGHGLAWPDLQLTLSRADGRVSREVVARPADYAHGDDPADSACRLSVDLLPGESRIALSPVVAPAWTTLPPGFR